MKALNEELPRKSYFLDIVSVCRQKLLNNFLANYRGFEVSRFENDSGLSERQTVKN